MRGYREKTPSMNQEVGLHQTLTESADALILDLTGLQNCEKSIPVVYKSPNLEYRVKSSMNRLRQGTLSSFSRHTSIFTQMHMI